MARAPKARSAAVGDCGHASIKPITRSRLVTTTIVEVLSSGTVLEAVSKLFATDAAKEWLHDGTGGEAFTFNLSQLFFHVLQCVSIPA
jgi:hypothetical protein